MTGRALRHGCFRCPNRRTPLSSVKHQSASLGTLFVANGVHAPNAITLSNRYKQVTQTIKHACRGMTYLAAALLSCCSSSSASAELTRCTTLRTDGPLGMAGSGVAAESCSRFCLRSAAFAAIASDLIRLPDGLYTGAMPNCP